MQPASDLRLIRCGLVGVKELAARYGISRSTVYELIRSDPTFPYRNVGMKKRLLIDVAEFEVWLDARMKREKERAFNLSTVKELLKKGKK